MSMHAYRWAKSWSEGLTSAQMFVLLMLADHYNESAKRAWPAIATLAHLTRLSTATVKRSLRDLKSMGLIEIEDWKDASGKQRINRYCLPFYDPESQVSPFPVVLDEFDHHGHAVGITQEGEEIAIAV